MSGLLAATVLLGTGAAVAQPAGLPPLAQAAVDRGLADAQRQDFSAAKDEFLEAWRRAPDAPQIWYYLGLSEAKLPGYELRSIAWFKLYLIKVPDASNAEGIRTQIIGLETVFEGRISSIVGQLEPLLMVSVNREQHPPSDAAPDLVKNVHENLIEIGWDLAATRFAIGDIAGAQRGLERTNGSGWQQEWEKRMVASWHRPLENQSWDTDARALFTAIASAGLLSQAVDMVSETNPNMDVAVEVSADEEGNDEDAVAFFLEQGDLVGAQRLSANPLANRVVIVCSPDELAQAHLHPDRCRDDRWWSQGRAADGLWTQGRIPFLLKTAVNGIEFGHFDEVHMDVYMRQQALDDPDNSHLVFVAFFMRRLALEYRKVHGPRGQTLPDPPMHAANSAPDSRSAATAAREQTTASDRIKASYDAAFCRPPRPEELQFWSGDPRSASLDALIAAHRVWLRNTPSERQATIDRSYRTIFNRDPRPDELAFWDGRVKESGETCSELLADHRRWKNANPDGR